ncbi:6-hydroxynicotinate 3-monooxygenase [Pseudocercospora fuligena]|uniref:6-hydroxynicotinate 3-monooxygenase n=1 Tax=Pseudocercospora fuligena TaxID=685502 RepID=A0A8H6RST0_9PEZI|nr:6-hydroxynicotinate 3-monooxygenase [Pseudocercospora fuligena]
MADSEKLRIAIIGAGIAGLAAAIALQRHEGIDVQVYERAPELREIGASIALGPNGMKALERLGVHEALSDELAFRNKSGFPMIYRHWKTNEVISVDEHRGDIEYRHRTSRFYRAHLQQALAAHVEPERIHLNKSFVTIGQSQETDETLIAFADGSTTSADIILGADGIQSAVRRSFVPTSRPKWTGWVAFRSVFDADFVSHIPGVLDEAYHWWGPDRTFFSSRLGKNLFTIVGGSYSDPDAADPLYKDSTWNSEGGLAALKDFYKDWHPTIRAMIEASPYTRMYPNTFASALDTWIHGHRNVTYAGDAAHAHGGAFAAGGSLALDDAWAFARAIFHVFPPDTATKPSKVEITKALQLYERTRKPHTDRVLATVHANNRKAVERLGKEETDEQLINRMRSRADPFWIHEHDVEATFEQVVREEQGEVQARL